MRLRHAGEDKVSLPTPDVTSSSRRSAITGGAEPVPVRHRRARPSPGWSATTCEKTAGPEGREFRPDKDTCGTTLDGNAVASLATKVDDRWNHGSARTAP